MLRCEAVAVPVILTGIALHSSQNKMLAPYFAPYMFANLKIGKVSILDGLTLSNKILFLRNIYWQRD
jgi:hypothetical protein